MGAKSGTLLGMVSAHSPIQIVMIHSRYCILGNVQDTCLMDPEYVPPQKEEEEGLDLGEGGDAEA